MYGTRPASEVKPGQRRFHSLGQHNSKKLQEHIASPRNAFPPIAVYWFVCFICRLVQTLYTHTTIEGRLEINIIQKQWGMHELGGTSEETSALLTKHVSRVVVSDDEKNRWVWFTGMSQRESFGSVTGFTLSPAAHHVPLIKMLLFWHCPLKPARQTSDVWSLSSFHPASPLLSLVCRHTEKRSEETSCDISETMFVRVSSSLLFSNGDQSHLMDADISILGCVSAFSRSPRRPSSSHIFQFRALNTNLFEPQSYLIQGHTKVGQFTSLRSCSLPLVFKLLIIIL